MKYNAIIRILSIILFACIFMPGDLIAQVKFYTLLSERRIGPDQTFQVQYIIEGANEVQEFKYPPFDNFDVEELFEGQNTSKSSSQSLNSSSHSLSRIAVLSPRKAGSFSIPGATAIINGRLMRSNAVKLQVSRQTALQHSNTARPNQVVDESEILPGQSISEKIRDNFFLTSEVSKPSCYVGEPLMAVYKACSRLNANSQVVKRPSLTGFSVIEMVNSYDGQPEIEVINGKAFFVHLIRKVQLFPLQAGNYELEGAEVESEVYFVKKTDESTAADELRQLIDGTRDRETEYTTIPHKVSLTTKSLPVVVKPLPEEGQPEDFSGAVGEFKIESFTDKKNIAGASPAKISFVISGTGNFPLVNSPTILWPKGLEVAAEQTSEQTNPHVFPLSGSKTFTFSITGMKAGKHTIPAATFSYFDPNEKKYKTIQSKPIEVAVSSISETSADLSAMEESGTGSSSRFPRHYYWFGAIALLIIGWILFQAFSSSKNKTAELSNPAEIEPLATEQSEQEVFSAAEFAIMQGDRKRFYRHIQKILVDFVASKCSILPSALNKHNIAGALQERKVSSDLIIQLQETLNECEWALYTPDTSQSDMFQMLQRSKLLYRELNTICKSA